jgi:uncharacterized protein DUF3617
MRKMFCLSAISLCASVVLAGAGDFRPLNVKTGLWEETWTSTSSGAPPMSADMQARLAQMTPEQRARIEAYMKSMTSGTPKTRIFKVCITKEKLNSNPFNDEKNAKDCTWSELISTGTKLDAVGTCVTGSEHIKTDVTMHVEALDSEHVKGTGKFSFSNAGNTMHSAFDASGKYLGPACGSAQ